MKGGIGAFVGFLLIGGVGFTLAGLAGPASAQEPPSVAGAWRSADAGSRMKLILEQDGTTLTGHFESGSGEQTWDVEGTISADGTIEMVRFIPIAELSGTPAPALAEVLRRHGDANRLGFLRGTVRLRFDAETGELKGEYGVIAVSYDTGSGELESAEERFVQATLRRATDLPDFEVESFTITRQEATSNGETADYWEITAEILNAGGDAPGRFTLRLEKVDRWSEGEPSFRGVADGGTSHPPLAAGETTTIRWRTDTPTATANRPNVVTHTDLAIRVVVDPDNQVEEASEANNEKALWRLSCAEPVTETTPRKEVIWVELPEGADAPGPAPDSYDALLDAMDDKAEAVLCRIKLEARRRAMIGAGSVAGSRFVKTLVTHFLKDYFAAPGREAGLAAIATLGKVQGYPRISRDPRMGISMYVPKGLRQRYPNYMGDWEWIYPATEFFRRGKHARLIRYLDIPFLVGSKNLGTGVDADVIGGGKNQSNVMHWATGAKYWYLPKDALRELFIGYELWHLEGWRIFGEDAINDLIAEEAGRMLGVRLARDDLRMRSEHDLVRKLDQDFREARAWVGAMLRLNQEKFDDLILAPAMPTSLNWWGWFGKPPQPYPPWPRASGAKTIRMMLDDGATVAEVSQSGLVEQLTQIYTLIHEVDEWERRHGAIGLTDVTRKVVEGDYDGQFNAAPKDWNVEWQWSP